MQTAGWRIPRADRPSARLARHLSAQAATDASWHIPGHLMGICLGGYSVSRPADCETPEM